MTRIFSTFAVLLFFFACVACSSDDNPTVEANMRKFFPAYCDKLSTCFVDEYKAAYPNGQSQCVQTAVDAIPAGDRGKQSACSQSEIDTCIQDAKNMSCAATLSASTLPSSCKKC